MKKVLEMRDKRAKAWTCQGVSRRNGQRMAFFLRRHHYLREFARGCGWHGA
jgi:hypothetical protein